MAASFEAIVNGLSATLILVTGYIIAIRMLFAMRHSESKLLPFQATMAFGFGSFYTGTVVSFWLLIFTNDNLYPRELAAILCYSITPIAIAAAMYTGFSMLKPKLAKPMAWVFGLSGILFWANLWFNIPEQGSTYTLVKPAEDLIDIELLSLSSLFTAIYIISLLCILGFGFIYLSTHSTGDIRKRSRNYAIGLILFSICGIIDSRINLGVYMVIVRLAMFVSYIFLYLAMIPPKPQFPPTKKE